MHFQYNNYLYEDWFGDISNSPSINGNGKVLKEELLVMRLDVGAFDPADPSDGIVESEVLDHCGDHHAGTAGAARAMNNTVSPLQKCFLDHVLALF